MEASRSFTLFWALAWLFQVFWTAADAAAIDDGLAKRASSSFCLITVTSTRTTTIVPTTTLEYQIISGEIVYDITSTNSAVPQLTPTTIYPKTVFTNGATSTSTVILIPSTTIGSYLTVTSTAPAGFLPIGDTLPKTPLTQRNAKRGLGPLCIATATVTKTVPGTSTFTATTVTTLTGILYAFEPFSTTVDNSGIARIQQTFYPTYTGYRTVRANTARTITTSYATTVFSTVTLPTQSFTGTTTTSYLACDANNIDYGGEEIAGVNRFDKVAYWALTATEIIPANFTTPDGRYSDVAGCCKAAFEYGGVAYWQYSPSDNTCRVARVAQDNTCVQADRNLTAEFTYPPSPTAGIVGNGVCGRFTDGYYVPPPPESSAAA
jgi:hypothetical protein